METGKLECERTYYHNKQIKSEKYSLDGRYHNPKPNGIALKRWHKNGKVQSEEYFTYDKDSKRNGIVYKEWNQNGEIMTELYSLEGKELTKEEFESRTNRN